MKKDIHPKYHPKAKVSCACGNEFTTGSTVENIKVELCHLCHPFYTGKQKLVDTARRVEKFQEKMAKKATLSKDRKSKKIKKAKKQESPDSKADEDLRGQSHRGKKTKTAEKKGKK